MRKYLSVALESGSNYRAGDYLALEDEEMVAMGEEASKAEAEVTKDDLPELDKMKEQSEVLEDLAVIADGIEEASPEEVALIRNVSDMAVAGSGVESEELLSEEVVPLEVEVTGQAEVVTEPGDGGSVLKENEDAVAVESYKRRKIATENFVGRRISQEGIAEIKHKAKQIWEAIVKFLKDVWAKIEKFFYNIFGTIPLLRKRCEALKKRAKEVSENSTLVAPKDQLDILSGISNLSVANEPITTGAGYVSAVGTLKTEVGKVSSYIDSCAKVGSTLADDISGFDPKDATATLSKIAGHTKGGVDYPSTSKTSDERWKDYTVWKSADLIGNKTVFARKKELGDGNHFIAVQSGQSFRVDLADTSTTASKKKDFKMTAISPAEAIKILDVELDMLDAIEKIHRGSKIKELVKSKDKIESAAKKAEGSYAKLNADKNAEGTDAIEAASLPSYRVCVDFALAYTHWATMPMKFVSHCTSTMSSVNGVIAKSLSSYKKKKED